MLILVPSHIEYCALAWYFTHRDMLHDIHIAYCALAWYLAITAPQGSACVNLVTGLT